ncbi:uncharacterized [Tachysurus ichikawai]
MPPSSFLITDLVSSGRKGALMDIGLMRIEHAHPSSLVLRNVLSFLSQEAGESVGQTARIITLESNVSRCWRLQPRTNHNNK